MNDVKKINKSIKNNYKKQNKLKIENNIEDDSYYFQYYKMYSTLLGAIDACIYKIKIMQNKKLNVIYNDINAVVDYRREQEKLQQLFHERSIIITNFKLEDNSLIYDFLSSMTLFQKFYTIEKFLNDYSNSFPNYSKDFLEIIKNYINSYNQAMSFEYEDINEIIDNYKSLTKKKKKSTF